MTSFLCLGLLLLFINTHSYNPFVYTVTVSNAHAKTVFSPETGAYVKVFGYGSDTDRERNTKIINSNTFEWNQQFTFDDDDDAIIGPYKYFLFKLYGDSLLGQTGTISVSSIKDCDAIYSKELNVMNDGITEPFRTLFVEISKIGCDNYKDTTSDIDESAAGHGYITPQEILNSKTITAFEGFTMDKWKNVKPLMHPTQPDVGYAWMIRKVCSDFNSAENTQAAMNPVWAQKWPYLNASDHLETGSTLPVIIGPAGPDADESLFYVIDSHHTLSALDYSGYDETWIYIHILNDFRHVSYEQLFEEMECHKRTYLYGQNGQKKELPEIVPFSDLPETFGELGDSTWRSLAGYSRKVKSAPSPFPVCDRSLGHSKYCMRPYIRVCGDDGFGIPFYEFLWGYFYVQATYVDTIYWPNEDALNDFIDVYDALLEKYYDWNGDFIDVKLPEQCDTIVEDWLNAASHLVPLARSDATANYSPLPGYIQGPQIVDDDPNCNFNSGPHYPHTSEND